MTSNQIKAFRRAVRGVSTRIDQQLTSAFNVTAHIAETQNGHQGVITVAAPVGRLQFNIDPEEEMFTSEGDPLDGEMAELSTNIAAASASELLQQTDIENAPAQ